MMAMTAEPSKCSNKTQLKTVISHVITAWSEFREPLMPMKQLILFALLGSLFSPIRALSDELILTNGDRVSGDILGLDDDGFDLQSDLFGTTSTTWDSIDEARSDGPLYLTFSGDELVVGTVVLTSTDIEVETEGAGVLRRPRADLVGIRSLTRHDEYLADLERQQNPILGDIWAASVDGALSLTDGNADTRSVNLALRSARTTPGDRTSFYLTSLFASNSTSGIGMTTANAVRGGTRYERDLTERLFTFGFADLEFDRFQDLDLRLVLGGGLGVNLAETSRNTFQVFGGGSSNQEFFNTGVRRNSGESVIGEEWTYRMSSVTALTERIAVYPNLTNLGQYRITFDSTATTRINDWLSWQVTLSDRYLSNPQPGKQPNDLLFTTGIRISLGSGSIGTVGPGDINFQ
jgi:putative salt-induced outer membrane protein